MCLLKRFTRGVAGIVAALVAAGCATAARPASPVEAPTIPVVDYHTHLFTRAAISRVYGPALTPVALPAEVDRLLADRNRLWNSPDSLATLYADSSVILDRSGPVWLRGNRAVSGYIGSLIRVQYSITPVAYGISGSHGHIAGYFSRPMPGGTTRHFGHVLLAIEKGVGDVWKITAESPFFPGPKAPAEYNAGHLLAQLDTAGISRALVLSTSYWFQSGYGAPVEDALGQVRAEHDWLAGQVAAHPDRLVGFCSLNPLWEHALEELARCAGNPHLRGAKLHFGDSRVDMLNPDHVARAKRLFVAANALRYPIMAHLMTGSEQYGRRHSELFLSELVAAAPDIPVQIAHLAGSGPGYWNVDSALAVFAEAASAGDPRMKNVYIDVATIVTLDESPETLALIARRIRQLGPQRVLFGSDYPASAELTPRRLWAAFRMLPLSDEEFSVIAGNVTPYMRR